MVLAFLRLREVEVVFFRLEGEAYLLEHGACCRLQLGLGGQDRDGDEDVHPAAVGGLAVELDDGGLSLEGELELRVGVRGVLDEDVDWEGLGDQGLEGLADVDGEDLACCRAVGGPEESQPFRVVHAVDLAVARHELGDVVAQDSIHVRGVGGALRLLHQLEVEGPALVVLELEGLHPDGLGGRVRARRDGRGHDLDRTAARVLGGHGALLVGDRAVALVRHIFCFC